MTIKFSSYMDGALRPKVLRDRALEALSNVHFDTIVGTGLSGTLPLQMIAEQFNVNMLAVRKDRSSCHSDGLLEGTLGNRWVLVDDFVSSGATVVRAMKAIDDIKVKTKFVGAFLYENYSGDMFQSAAELTTHTRMIQHYLDDHAKGKSKWQNEPVF